MQAYEFDVELVAQAMTSMHGSKEQHMGYIYKRSVLPKKGNAGACDRLFAPSWDLVNSGLLALHEEMSKQMEATMGQGRKTRSRK